MTVDAQCYFFYSLDSLPDSTNEASKLRGNGITYRVRDVNGGCSFPNSKPISSPSRIIPEPTFGASINFLSGPIEFGRKEEHFHKQTFSWSPTGKARGTSMTYPPTPMGAETLRRKCRGFGGLSASSGIRRSINPRAQE